MTIPDAHPRLWWTPERIAQAKHWYHKNHFIPTRNGYDPNFIYDQLFAYIATGHASECRTAIDWALRLTISEGQLKGVASDNARWHGERVILTYDWCHDEMSAEERQTLIERWNNYLDVIRKKNWGGMGMPASNYFWGYWRNELEWGIATKGENPSFQTFLDSALLDRWQNVFVPYAANGRGMGGIGVEGSEYGPVMGAYATVPLVSAKLLGRNLFAETNWYKEAIYGLIYLTTPSETYRKGGSAPYYQMSAWADCCDNSSNYPLAKSYYWGATLHTLAMEYDGTDAAAHARQWLKLVQPTAYKHVLAVDPGGPAKSFSTLPPDYYAPGPEYFSTRSSWSGKGAFAFIQVGVATGAGHNHRDRGSFQFWCDGRWLSKESTGYAVRVRGYDGDAVGSETSIPHNLLLFGGSGISEAYDDGPPRVLRLESRPDYSYIAYDMSDTYRSHRSGYKGVHDNPYAKTAIREFILVRPLDTLLIFDRMESQSDVLPGDDRHQTMRPEDVVKTFVLHTENRPEIDGNVLSARSGNELLTAWTLVPGNPKYRVVDEGDIPAPSRGYVYQYRTEIETAGAPQSYFLNVLQGHDAKDPQLEVTVDETSTAFTVKLRHAKRGAAKAIFLKGMSSAGGEFGYAASGEPRATGLSSGIMRIHVDDSGPHWEEAR